jgi:four helix bundle protein
VEVHSNRHDLSPILLRGQELPPARAGTSWQQTIAPQYLARSRAEFGATIGLLLESADETASWLELLIDSKFMEHPDVSRI